jgi:acyl carrier protein
MTEINADIAQILRDELFIETTSLTRDSHLIDEVGLDSVAFAVAMVAIEEKFGAILSEEELMACETIADLEDAVFAKQG